jgi:hypothetical protein
MLFSIAKYLNRLVLVSNIGPTTAVLKSPVNVAAFILIMHAKQSIDCQLHDSSEITVTMGLVLNCT